MKGPVIIFRRSVMHRPSSAKLRLQKARLRISVNYQPQRKRDLQIPSPGRAGSPMGPHWSRGRHLPYRHRVNANRTYKGPHGGPFFTPTRLTRVETGFLQGDLNFAAKERILFLPFAFLLRPRSGALNRIATAGTQRFFESSYFRESRKSRYSKYFNCRFFKRGIDTRR